MKIISVRQPTSPLYMYVKNILRQRSAALLCRLISGSALVFHCIDLDLLDTETPGAAEM